MSINSWGYWESFPAVISKTPELVEMRPNWSGYPVIKKKIKIYLYMLKIKKNTIRRE